MNFQSHIVKIESVLRLWCMRNFQKYKTNIKTNFCENFKFQQCLEPSIRSLKNVPNIYKEMTTNWAKNWSCSLYLPSALLSQLLWFNSSIDSKGTFISGFASHIINFVCQIFDDNGKTVARS